MDNEKQREEFNAIPAERTFCTIKLYLDAENAIVGLMQYDGGVLKALGVPKELATECMATARLAQQYCQRAVNEAGVMAGIVGVLHGIFGEGEGNDEGSNDGSDSRAATAATSGE